MARIDDVIDGYAAASVEMIPRFEAITSAELYTPVVDLLPASPSRIVDIGAGTGRDAAWLAGMGHDVTAVEPVDALRQAGRALHGSSGIAWLNDRLPDLQDLKSRGRFDCVILCAVWQHLDDDQRRTAMHNLARLMAPGGLVIMSLRHGRGAPNRSVHEVRPKDTIGEALGEGFHLIRERRMESVQAGNRAAGVYWTWLALGWQRAP
jgi:2-polyprenyl-3-methyl-5-hydroxy-6-metoxy-1,4-benzoquinol methylase